MIDPGLRRMIHGVVMVAFAGTEVPDWVRDADGLAGVVLFGSNTPDPQTTARLAAQLRAAHPSLLLAIDEEGGDVTRIQALTGSSLPGAAALGAIDDVGLTEQAGHCLGRVLRACDIDMTLAPVLDIASDPDNPVIGVRSFGSDADLVARHAVAFAAGLRTAGVATCGKHAPGHGDTAVDSHLGLPELALSPEQLASRELVPFRAAIDAGVDALMTGHLRVPALGPAPASLEPAVTELLRGLGFTGAIMTDALDMGAVTGLTDGDLGEVAIRALLAGADLLCLGSPDHIDGDVVAQIITAIAGAVASGRIPLDRLQAAGTRARDVARAVTERPDLAQALTALDDLGAQIARRAITTQGDVSLRAGDCLLDLRERTDQAAGTSVAALPRLLAAELGLVLGELPDRRLAVITRDRGELVDQVLARRPDAVVLHTGVPAAAPAAANLVLGYGAGRACAAEIAARCRPDLVNFQAPTELPNPHTTQLDTLDSEGIASLILTEDLAVVPAVQAAAADLAKLIDLGVAAVAAGGRVHYVGSGTSGRLGVLDTAELLPTYGAGPESFVAHLSGGDEAMFRAVEGAEDDAAAGADAMADLQARDLVVGIAASGRTPYARGALEAARKLGASTGLISTNPQAELAAMADVSVLIDTGPEAVTGSTRMKAGTATKLAINTFSTAVMVRCGKTYGNLMVDFQASNDKLRGRAVRMLMQATGAGEDAAAAALAQAGQVRAALVMLQAGCDREIAHAALAAAPPDSGRIGDPGGLRTAIAWARDQQP
ncbi:MAG: N-acetylmuramic acid 6-phosphate etherase [Beutenbergiaceae bacterium]